MPEIFMPRLSDTMEEGVISRWLKAEGDQVSKGDVLAEIETDKATMDLEAFDSGVLTRLLVPEGTTVPIGQAIAVLGDGSAAAAPDGASAPTAAPGPSAAPAQAQSAAPAEPVAAPASPAGGGSTEAAAAAAPGPGERVKASPVVRSLARTHGIELSAVTGTGPAGRIIRADIESLIGSGAPVPASAASGTAPRAAAPAAQPGSPGGGVVAPVGAAGEQDEALPLSSIRRITARRLTESFAVPQFCLTSVLDAKRLLGFRAKVNAALADGGTRISVTDLLVRACAVTLRAHPEVNSAFGGDSIIRRGSVNVGVAVALDQGLIVPVIRDADTLSVTQIASRSRDLISRARAGKLAPEEFSGGTFTISNLGMYAIENFTALLNPPEAAILAVGATTEAPVLRDGKVKVRPLMKLNLTVDHRVLDGATGAAFLKDLVDLLGDPLRIVV